MPPHGDPAGTLQRRNSSAAKTQSVTKAIYTNMRLDFEIVVELAGNTSVLPSSAAIILKASDQPGSLINRFVNR